MLVVVMDFEVVTILSGDGPNKGSGAGVWYQVSLLSRILKQLPIQRVNGLLDALAFDRISRLGPLTSHGPDVVSHPRVLSVGPNIVNFRNHTALLNPELQEACVIQDLGVFTEKGDESACKYRTIHPTNADGQKVHRPLQVVWSLVRSQRHHVDGLEFQSQLQ